MIMTARNATVRLDVYVDGQLAGLLEQPSPREYRFTYYKEGLPVSLTMPVRLTPYIAPYLFPVFQVSLPEGPLRAAIERDLLKRVHADGDMAVLSIVGAHLIGAISVVPEGASPDQARDAVDFSSLMRHGGDPAFVADLLRRYAHQSGVSGGYPKILADGNPPQGTMVFPDWIIKIPDADHSGMVMNEFYSMQAAQKSGIETADARLSDEGRLLLVRRFDRDEAGNRLAFEDMASLMGLPSSAKFSGSVERIVKTLVAFCDGSSRTTALEQFFCQYALAMILRNGDAHLKNFGVLYSPRGGGRDVRLAPCYDMVTMAAYAPITPSGGTQDIPAIMWRNAKRWFKPRDFTQLGALCGIARIDAHLYAIASGAHSAAQALADAMRDQPDNFETGTKMLLLWRDGLQQAGLLREHEFPALDLLALDR